MYPNLRVKCLPAVLTLVAMTTLGGCVKTIPIAQYPIFWDQAPKTIAVTPFRNETRRKHIHMQVTSDLATQLSSNGSYTVYDRTHLGAYMDEQTLQNAFSNNPDTAAAAMVQIGKVDAILTGTITTCHWPPTITDVKVATQEIVNPDGSRHIKEVRQYTPINEAELKVNATLLRITPNGRVVILDFGISRDWRSEEPDRDSLVVLGTPGYLAPERLAEAPASPASDMFAVGVMLLEVLAGQRADRANPAGSLRRSRDDSASSETSAVRREAPCCASPARPAPARAA